MGMGRWLIKKTPLPEKGGNLGIRQPGNSGISCQAALCRNALREASPWGNPLRFAARAIAGIFVISTVAASIILAAGSASQCPNGHFCYFYLLTRITRLKTPVIRRNALTGIFVFSTVALKLIEEFAFESQCPNGHFCFFYPAPPEWLEQVEYGRSQCPNGHFCFFYCHILPSNLYYPPSLAVSRPKTAQNGVCEHLIL